MPPKKSVKTTLTKFLHFLKWENIDRRYTWYVEEAIIEVLERTLRDKVFRSHSQTYKIEDVDELAQRIRSGDTTPDGAPYNKEYLRRKRRVGEYLPHKFDNYAFWFGAQADHWTNKVVMMVKDTGTIETTFDYVSHHEKQRSVLKATFLLAWDEIVETILETYIKYMK